MMRGHVRGEKVIGFAGCRIRFRYANGRATQILNPDAVMIVKSVLRGIMVRPIFLVDNN